MILARIFRPFLPLLIVFSAALSADQKTVSIANSEWAPYTSETLPEHGYLSHLTKEAFAQSGVTVDWRWMPWRRALAQTQHSTVEASIGWIKTAERKEKFLYSAPLMTMTWSLFQNHNNRFDFHSHADLAGKVIGVHSSSEYPSLRGLKAAGDITIMPFHTYAFALRALLSGRVDGVVAPEVVGYHTIRTDFSATEAAQFFVPDTKMDTLPIYLITAKSLKRGPEIIDSFNKGIKALKASGRYEGLITALNAGDYDLIKPRKPTTVRLVNGEWAPFLSEHAPHYGLISHLTSEAFAASNIEVEWQFTPWGRALSLVVRGVWDGSSGWLKTPDREKDLLYSDPIMTTGRIMLQLKSNSFEWQTIEDLAGKSFGVTIASGYPQLRPIIDSGAAKTLRFPDYETAIGALLSGRIDAVPLPRKVSEHLIRNKFASEAEKFHIAAKEIEALPLYLIVSKNIKKGPMIIERFNEGLKKLRQSGEYDAYMQDLELGLYDTVTPIETPQQGPQ